MNFAIGAWRRSGQIVYSACRTRRSLQTLIGNNSFAGLSGGNIPSASKTVAAIRFPACRESRLSSVSRTARQRLLDLMVARIGRHRVAARLGVPLGILDDWLGGGSAVPDAKLVMLIDLIDETSED